MTNRTFPVGVLVLVLASLVAVGCTAQTSAVFKALLDPATASRSGLESSPTVDPADAAAAAPTWWAHPHGYAMALPGGWAGVVVDANVTSRLLDALTATRPALAERILGVLEGTGAGVSMVAVDLSSDADVPPMVIVVAQPTHGARARAVKNRVADALAALPGIQAEPVRSDDRLPDAESVRFDFTLADADLGTLRIRSHLFRFGGQAYLVSFIAPDSTFDAAGPDFDAIAESLRFGI